MKKLLLLLCISFTSFAQNYTIKGTIEELGTGEKLPFVSVYINNTAKGSFSDENGNFQIKNISLTKVELIASMIGYDTYRKTIELKQETEIVVKIQLKPAENALNEVVITAKKDKKWQNQYNRFLKEFLGNSPFARQCELKNGHILQFDENKTNDEFAAKATQPLEITNDALGYTIFFDLKAFSVLPSKTTITGFTRFMQSKTEKTEQIKKWQINRQKAYLGSDKHFFSTVFDRSWEKNGFMVYRINPSFHSDKNVVTSIEEQLGKRLLAFDSSSVVILQDLPNKNRKILLPKEIEVLYTKQTKENSYRDAPFPVSWIYSSMPLEISSLGNVSNTQFVEFSGEMSNRRMAEILPLDYQPNEAIEIEDEQKIIAQNDYTKYQEFPYLHFNKPFYTIGEKVWFKAYMFYQTPSLRDSLSKVLYIELIDEKNRILEKKILKLKNGISWGDFMLPKTETEQNFRIRAYTNWMLNYGDKNIFQRTIPTVFPTQKVVFDGIKPSSNDLFDTKLLKKNTDSCDIYSVSIKLKNPEKRANFSVSVVNSAIVDDDNENLTSFKPNFGALAFKQKYEAEQSLSIEGRLFPAKKTSLAIMSQADGSVRIIDSDSLGNFKAENYDFEDSLTVGIQAEKGIKISLDERTSPAVSKENKSTFTRKNISVQSVDYQADKSDISLDEVVVKGNKIVNEERKEYLDRFNKIYGNPDVTIGEKEIAENATTAYNLLTILQGKVPGLRVVEYLSPVDGSHKTGIEIRTASTQTFQSSTSPLLLLDGIRMENTDAFLEVSPYSIERIDILKSASSTAIFGATGYNGVIAVYTKAGSNKRKEFGSKEVDFQVFTFEGFSSPNVFKTPSCQNMTDRTTLCWLPNLSTNENGEAEFKFSVNPKIKFRMVIEGINRVGEKGRFVEGN